jgi:plastocyanin
MPLVLAVLLTTACGLSTSSPTGGGPLDVAPTVPVPTPSPAPTGAPTTAAASSPAAVAVNDTGSRDAVGLADVEIEVADFAFRPSTLQGTPGQKLRIAIENASNTTHTFSLDAQGVRQEITSGGRATVEVTFPASGATRFVCALHTAQGMNGQLVAGPARP